MLINNVNGDASDILIENKNKNYHNVDNNIDNNCIDKNTNNDNNKKQHKQQ